MWILFIKHRIADTRIYSNLTKQVVISTRKILANSIFLHYHNIRRSIGRISKVFREVIINSNCILSIRIAGFACLIQDLSNLRLKLFQFCQELIRWHAIVDMSNIISINSRDIRIRIGDRHKFTCKHFQMGCDHKIIALTDEFSPAIAHSLTISTECLFRVFVIYFSVN